jgi:hypothetical protein
LKQPSFWPELSLPAAGVTSASGTPPSESDEPPKSIKKSTTSNPMVAVYGPGPEGAQCRSCVHIHGLQYAKTYYKCDRRQLTHGRRTDHYVNWPACGQYEPSIDGKPQMHWMG